MITPTLPPGRYLLGLAGGLALVGVLLIGSTLYVNHRNGANRLRSAAAENPVAEPGGKVATETDSASASAQATASSGSSDSAEASEPPSPAVAAPVSSAAGAKVDAYRGLGSWVDIYDDRAWADPSAAVADMARHGVRTLFIETANSRSAVAVKQPAQMQTFITAAHAHDMKVVAWYLPDMKDLAKDYSRIQQAIDFTTADGQKFDSFSLDIESGAVKSQSARNRALITLSDQIRAHVGASYPLGAIIPSPLGLSKKGSYWGTLPYEALATRYDVFVPMSYYTYHGDGAAKAYADTIANMRILRSKPGCAQTPVHLIGGEAVKSSAGEVRGFVRAARDTGAIGASLYSWPGTKAVHWEALKPIVP